MGSPAQKTFLLSSSVQMPILLAPTFLLNIFASALGAAPQRQHTPSSAATCCHHMLSPLWHFLSLAGLHQQFLAPGGLHQGNWRVDWGKNAFSFFTEGNTWLSVDHRSASSLSLLRCWSMLLWTMHLAQMPRYSDSFSSSKSFCDFQRLAKRKQKKQVELDKCAFDPEHMEEPHNGGSFPMVRSALLIIFFYLSAAFRRLQKVWDPGNRNYPLQKYLCLLFSHLPAIFLRNAKDDWSVWRHFPVRRCFISAFMGCQAVWTNTVASWGQKGPKRNTYYPSNPKIYKYKYKGAEPFSSSNLKERIGCGWKESNKTWRHFWRLHAFIISQVQ